MPAQSGKKQHRGSLDDLIGFQLRVAQTRVFKDFEQSIETLGITPAGFSVLEVLRQNPGLTQSKLAEAVNLDRSSVVPLLDKLETKHLLYRQTSTKDRRNNHLYLNEQGIQLLEVSKERVAEHEARISRTLNRDERNTLISLLSRLAPTES
ncbi:MAG TPA: MarR family transcriptional regulator [Rhodocyclaceae bacterium]|nr:MarR family transcriptional regulator [Rhodocyclaceae bacterium]